MALPSRGIIGVAICTLTLSACELAETFTDQGQYFVSESTVCRILKAHEMISIPAFIVLKAADPSLWRLGRGGGEAT